MHTHTCTHTHTHAHTHMHAHTGQTKLFYSALWYSSHVYLHHITHCMYIFAYVHTVSLYDPEITRNASAT